MHGYLSGEVVGEFLSLLKTIKMLVVCKMKFFSHFYLASLLWLFRISTGSRLISTKATLTTEFDRDSVSDPEEFSESESEFRNVGARDGRCSAEMCLRFVIIRFTDHFLRFLSRRGRFYKKKKLLERLKT
jgi:hypothetical protein